MVCGIFILRKVLLPRDLSTAHLTTVSMKYFPHTPDDIRQMLEVIGVNSLDDLYAEPDWPTRTPVPYASPEPVPTTTIRRR